VQTVGLKTVMEPTKVVLTVNLVACEFIMDYSLIRKIMGIGGPQRRFQRFMHGNIIYCGQMMELGSKVCFLAKELGCRFLVLQIE
jgi:hypothetical protein